MATRTYPLATPAATPEQAAATPAAAWRLGWGQPAFRRSWLLLLALMFGGVVPATPRFFHVIQQRAGWLLPDPVLALLPRHDVTAPIFLLVWGAVGLGVGWLLVHPRLFLRGMWALLLLLVLRMATIWLVPLVPPLDIVPLADPLTDRLFHTAASEAITHDLFFSGHTATVTLLALAVRGRWWRGLLGGMAVAVAVLVLVQRVHYTYDVLAAPCFSWGAYWLGSALVRRVWPSAYQAG
ncbi:MAG: phosphatase PAP2-related protein [Janthinobacterium lividum]